MLSDPVATLGNGKSAIWKGISDRQAIYRVRYLTCCSVGSDSAYSFSRCVQFYQKNGVGCAFLPLSDTICNE